MSEYTFITVDCAECGSEAFDVPEHIADMDGRPLCSECSPDAPI